MSKNSVAESIVRGFTLIELMTVVAVIAILASLAFPAYENYGLRARRAVAQAFVSQIALKEEERFAHMRSYTGTIGAGGLSLVEPTETNGYYQYEVCCTDTTLCAATCNSLVVPTNGFIVMARRLANSPQMKDTVGEVVLYSTSAKCTTSVADQKWGNRPCS